MKTQTVRAHDHRPQPVAGREPRAASLRAPGPVVEFTFSQSSVVRLALTLYRALKDHQLGLPDDDDLIDELTNVHLVETSPGNLQNRPRPR